MIPQLRLTRIATEVKVSLNSTRSISSELTIATAHKIYLNFARFSEGFSINPVKLFKLGIFSDVTPQISGKFYQCQKSYLYFFLLLSHIISNEKQQNLKSHNNILYRKNI